MASSLPPELVSAVNKAGAKYGVPPSILIGIWRIESGSTFPNPAVNKIGYGGLFGTKDWNGPTQEQANLAAQILSHLVHQYNGNMSTALYHYSGGGYTSVPGEAGGYTRGSSQPTSTGNQTTPNPRNHPDVTQQQAAPQVSSAATGFDDSQLPITTPGFSPPPYLPPGSGQEANYIHGGGAYTSRLWQQIQNQPNLSPDTLMYAQNVQTVG